MDNQLTVQNTIGLKFQLLLSVTFNYWKAYDFRIVRNHTPKWVKVNKM